MLYLSSFSRSYHHENLYKKRPHRVLTLQGHFFNLVLLFCYIRVCPETITLYYLSALILACAAAKRAIGTRKGEQDT